MTVFAARFHLRPKDVRELTLLEFDRFADAAEKMAQDGG